LKLEFEKIQNKLENEINNLKNDKILNEIKTKEDNNKMEIKTKLDEISYLDIYGSNNIENENALYDLQDIQNIDTIYEDDDNNNNNNNKHENFNSVLKTKNSRNSIVGLENNFINIIGNNNNKKNSKPVFNTSKNNIIKKKQHDNNLSYSNIYTDSLDHEDQIICDFSQNKIV
jgi:hypothetical protein